MHVALCASQGLVRSLLTSVRAGPGLGDVGLGLQWPEWTALMSVAGRELGSDLRELELQVTDSDNLRLVGVRTGDGES